MAVEELADTGIFLSGVLGLIIIILLIISIIMDSLKTLSKKCYCA